MNLSSTCLLTFALLCTHATKAQNQPSYSLHPILQPGSTIAGQTFARDTTIASAAINEAGEIAFLADPGDGVETAFTSRRIVATAGDVIDAKILVLIAGDSPIAINKAGQVLYQAWYADTEEIAGAHEASAVGLFVDKHLALTLTPDTLTLPYFLTDDGRVVREQNVKSPSPLPIQGPTGRLGEIHLTPPKLPKGFPISIGQPIKDKKTPAPEVSRREPEGFPTLVHNSRGQMVISARYQGGFVLLIATPVQP